MQPPMQQYPPYPQQMHQPMQQPGQWYPQKPPGNWVGKILLVFLLITPLVVGVTWGVLVEIRMAALQQTLDDGVKKDMSELRTQMSEYRKSVDATRAQLIRSAEAMENIAGALAPKNATDDPATNAPSNRPPR